MASVMSPESREKIRKNYANLADHLETKESSLLHELVADKVITTHQMATIKSKPTNHDMNSTLLEILLRKSQEQLDDFIRVLRRIGQDSVANLLDESPKDATSFRVNNMDFKAPAKRLDFHNHEEEEEARSKKFKMDHSEKEKELHLEDLTLSDGPGDLAIHVKSSSNDYYNQNKNASYSIEDANSEVELTRGGAFIVNIEKNRPGSEYDGKNMKTLLKRLGFNTVLESDLPAKDIEKKLSAFATDPSRASNSMCVVVLMAHGSRNIIHGGDDDKVYLDDVFEIFDNVNAPLLRGKPKLFLIQACRGGKLDEGVEADGFVSKYLKEQHQGDDKVQATFDDYIISYATQEGGVVVVK